MTTNTATRKKTRAKKTRSRKATPKKATAKKATTEAAAEKPKGRPPGAKTAEREVVTEVTIAARCSCGSTDEPISQRVTSSGKASGTIHGLAYGFYQHVRCKCGSCGRALLLRRFSVEPLDSISAEMPAA